MADTQRSLTALQALFADNATGDIGAQDLRDFLVSVLGGYGGMSVKDNITGQTIGVTPEKITQWDTDNPSSGVTPDSTTDNDLTVQESGVYFICASLSFSGSNNSEWKINLRINGVENNCQGERKLGVGGDVGSLTITCMDSLAAGDVLTIWAEADSAAQDILVQSAQFNVKRMS